MTTTPYHNVNNTFLYVQTADAGLPNLVQNPRGDLGAWGYVTPVTNTVLTAESALGYRQLKFKTNVSQAAYFTTEFLPATAGKYYSAMFDSPSGQTSGTNVRIRFEWYDVSQVLLSSSTQSAAITDVSAQTNYYGAIVAPASTAYVKLRWDFYGTGTGNPAANAFFYLHNVMVTYSDTATVQTIRHNLSKNPSQETSVSWTAAVDGLGGTASAASSTAQAFAGTKSVKFTNTSGGTENIFDQLLDPSSARPSVTAGKTYTYSAYYYPPVNRSWMMRLVYYDNTGALIKSVTSNTFTSNGTTNLWNRGGFTHKAPTGAVSVIPQVYVLNVGAGGFFYVDAFLMEQSTTQNPYFDGNSTGTGVTYTWDGTANLSQSTSATTAGVFPYSNPITWRNIIGSAYDIDIQTDEMNVGAMTVSISDALLDPAINDDLKPGNAIWLKINDPLDVDGTGTGSVFVGKIDNAKSTYGTVLGKQYITDITLTAYNNMNVLANQKANYAVANISQLPYILEGKGVPWNVNGSGDEVSSATTCGFNDNASVVDQIAIVRDSALGYAWCSRDNVVNAWDAASMDATVKANFSDTDTTMSYSDIDVDFDTARTINSVTITWVRANGDTINYGPYIDATSVNTWGSYAATFTMTGSSESPSAIATLANAILTANSTPQRRVNGLTFPVVGDDTFHYATLDLYDKLMTTIELPASITASHQNSGS